MRRARILVVEDEANIRDILESFLAVAGYEVLLAGTFQEGMDFLRSEPIDLLLTDINLPDGSGYDLIRFAHATKSLADLPIVVFTGNWDPSETDGLPVTAVIPKPSSFWGVVNSITTILQK